MQTLRGTSAAPRRERGLGYALAGGLGITLLAILLGAAYWLWFYTSQRGASPPQLLPADTQLYITTAPAFGDTPDFDQLTAALRNELGIQDAAALGDAAIRLSGVSYDSNILTWIGSEVAVSVRGASADDLTSADPGDSLLTNAEIVFFFSSRNDPQAEVFLTKHLAAREARGERIISRQVGEVTVYEQESGPPSSIAAFALIEHYIVFSNRADALLALASHESDDGSLSSLPSFAAFRERLSPRIAAATFSDGSQDAEAARSALRQILDSLK